MSQPFSPRLSKAVLLASTAWIAFMAPAALSPVVAFDVRTLRAHEGTPRLLQPVDTVTTTYTYDSDGNITGKTTVVTSPPPPPNCFPAGSAVEMADGRAVPIESIKVGDLVRGRHREANEVLALTGARLGNRPLYLINGEHRTTGEHIHWSEEGPMAIDPRETERAQAKVHRVICRGGRLEPWRKPRLSMMTRRLATGTTAIHCDGFKAITSVEICRAAGPRTLLYDLVVGGSHVMWVDGYLVAGWADETDFDYGSWQHRDALQFHGRRFRRFAA
jgi:hypothetical protein